MKSSQSSNTKIYAIVITLICLITVFISSDVLAQAPPPPPPAPSQSPINVGVIWLALASAMYGIRLLMSKKQ